MPVFQRPSVQPADQRVVVIVLAGRRQSRKALGRQAERDHAPAVSIAVTEVLDIVEHNGDLGRPTTVTDLGRTLCIDQPRASKLAGQAIATGLLRREADQQDGRRSPLQLTAGGRAYLDQPGTGTPGAGSAPRPGMPIPHNRAVRLPIIERGRGPAWIRPRTALIVGASPAGRHRRACRSEPAVLRRAAAGGNGCPA